MLKYFFAYFGRALFAPMRPIFKVLLIWMVMVLATPVDRLNDPVTLTIRVVMYHGLTFVLTYCLKTLDTTRVIIWRLYCVMVLMTIRLFRLSMFICLVRMRRLIRLSVILVRSISGLRLVYASFSSSVPFLPMLTESLLLRAPFLLDKLFFELSCLLVFVGGGWTAK